MLCWSKPKRSCYLLFLILVAAGVLSYTVGKDFLPPLDEGAIWVQVQLPPGISIEKSKAMGAELRKTLKQFDEVSYVMTQVGRDDEGAEAFSLSHIECGVGLKPYDTWKFGKTKADLIEEMSEKLLTMPGYTCRLLPADYRYGHGPDCRCSQRSGDKGLRR